MPDTTPTKKPRSPITGVIADLDGVLYRGDTPIADAVAAFQQWERAGIPYRFVTNNATQSAAFFAAKLCGMGVATTAAQVVTSAASAARYLKDRRPAGTRVTVLGSQALIDGLTEAGFAVGERDAEIVVVGLDREMTYAKLRNAVRGVLGGATLIGTNADILLPVESGFDPGAGSLLAAVVAATRATPTIIGKPEPYMIELALKDMGTAAETTVMIGDQVATDIIAGQRAGLRSILVTTGIGESAEQRKTADLVVDRLLDIPFT